MSFTDDLKRSLGFEETQSKNANGPSFIDSILSVLRPPENSNPQQQYNPNPRNPQNPNPRPQPREEPLPVEDDFEVIIPEQSFYEIVLIRPKTIDDINYVVDQVIEEQNPVIIDLSFLERESAPNFKLAGDKIKQIRAKHGAQALLLSRSEEKNLIMISPKKVKVITKR